MSDTTKFYRIVHLQASNIQCLKAEGVEIVPNRSTIVLTGRNASGKSSILNSILWTLAGGKSIPEQPIRRGASRADTMVDMGEFVASLRITQSAGAKLTVKSKDGQDIRQPATLLKSYSNEILLDPVAFMRLSETPEGRRRQAETLRQLVGLDFGPLDAKKASAYEERKAVNRDLDQAKAKLLSYKLDPSVPAEEVSVAKLMQELNEVQETGRKALDNLRRGFDAELAKLRAHNSANELVVRAKDSCAQNLAHREGDLRDLDARIKDMEDLLAKYRADRQAMDATVTALRQTLADQEKKVGALQYANEEALTKAFEASREVVQVDLLKAVEPIQIKISQADDINTKVRANRRYKELRSEVAQLQEKADGFTAVMELVEKTKQEQLAASRFPLPGLSFDEHGVLLNGLPLSQGSQAQQLKAVLAIGFALKPRIRVALVRDASILDEDSLKEIETLMDQFDGQAWLEVVSSSDPTAIVIEDGGIKE